MKAAIMQPYFFPYIGYFQLMHAVDTFVIYDDVNYIKQGWINRNYILANRNQKSLMTLQLSGAGSFKHINEIEIGRNKEKIVKSVSAAYGKAPYFRESFPFLRDIILDPASNLAVYLANGLRQMAQQLNISCEFLLSSSLPKEDSLKGQDKVIDICRHLKADTYINAIGGQRLYDKAAFREHGIELYFLKTGDIRYKQFGDDFIPHLSVLDIWMFNPVERIQTFLTEYELI